MKKTFLFLLFISFILLYNCNDEKPKELANNDLNRSGSPCLGIPTVDYGGKTYNTVQIGNQCWLKENLDIGTMILGTDEMSDNGIIEKYCYDDNPTICETYGGLYQWNEAMQYVTTEGTQGICPPGWHIPTSAEFKTLINAVGGDGNALKVFGHGSGGRTGFNTSGFSALFSGARQYDDGDFGHIVSTAHFWSSAYRPGEPPGILHDGRLPGGYGLEFYNYGDNIYFVSVSTLYGYSVRCLKD